MFCVCCSLHVLPRNCLYSFLLSEFCSGSFVWCATSVFMHPFGLGCSVTTNILYVCIDACEQYHTGFGSSFCYCLYATHIRGSILCTISRLCCVTCRNNVMQLFSIIMLVAQSAGPIVLHCDSSSTSHGFTAVPQPPGLLDNFTLRFQANYEPTRDVELAHGPNLKLNDKLSVKDKAQV